MREARLFQTVSTDAHVCYTETIGIERNNLKGKIPTEFGRLRLLGT